MLHNLVITAPGRGQAIGQAALQMGTQGMERSFVPDSADVLVHTSLLQPKSSETIFFTAPVTLGDYDFLCTFPGHAVVMRGILQII